MSQQETDENILALPPVAKKVFLPCKKCTVNRFFTVVAHKSETSAKVQCEVCGSSKTFTLKKAKKAKAPKTGKPKAASKTSSKGLYEKMFQEIGANKSKPYNVKTKFEVNNAIDHSKFGLGFVTLATPVKVEVVFADEVRSLVHNRP